MHSGSSWAPGSCGPTYSKSRDTPCKVGNGWEESSFQGGDKQEAENGMKCPMLAGDGQAGSPLTCTGHKGDDGTADALVVPGINAQGVSHPGIEVCQLYRLGLGLNRDSFFRMVAWGTETSVSLGPGTRSWRGSAWVPGHRSRAEALGAGHRADQEVTGQLYQTFYAMLTLPSGSPSAKGALPSPQAFSPHYGLSTKQLRPTSWVRAFPGRIREPVSPPRGTRR